MSKSMIDSIVAKAFKNWGTSKTYLVFFLTLFGAGICGSAGVVFIPNSSELEEPQNETKSTKTKKENV